MSLDIAKGSLGAKSPSWEPLIYQDLNNLTAASISDLIRLPQLPLLYFLKTQGHSYPRACCSLSLGISMQMSPPALGFPWPPSGQEPPAPTTFYHVTLFSFLHALIHVHLSTTICRAPGRTWGQRPWDQAMWPQGGGPLHHIPDKRGHRHNRRVCHQPYPRKLKLMWEKDLGDWHHTCLLPIQHNVANRSHFLFKGPDELHLVEPRWVGLGKRK